MSMAGTIRVLLPGSTFVKQIGATVADLHRLQIGIYLKAAYRTTIPHSESTFFPFIPFCLTCASQFGTSLSISGRLLRAVTTRTLSLVLRVWFKAGAKYFLASHFLNSNSETTAAEVRAMAACIVASISPVAGSIDVEDQAKLVAQCLEPLARLAVQGEFGEDFKIKSYVMTAARRDDSPAIAPPLRKGAQPIATSPAHKQVANMPPEQRPMYVEALQKSLHDVQEGVRSPASENYKGADRGVPDEAAVGIQMPKVVVIELDNVNETCSEGNKKCNENCEEYLTIPASTRVGNAKVSFNTGDPEVTAVVLDDVAEVTEIEGDDEKSTSADVIAEAPSNFLIGRVTPTGLTEANSDTAEASESEEESDRIRTTAVQSSDESEPQDRNDVGQAQFQGKLIATDLDAASKVEVTVGVPIFYPIIQVESKEKIEDLSVQAANIYNVDNVDSETMLSRSFSFTGLNHVAFCVENLERSLDFYCGLLGLKTNMDRPHLPYRGAWLFLGGEGIHLMEVPNPDPVHGRPAHGGFDRHACLNCKNVEGVRLALEKAGIPRQPSPVPSIFTRDPDGNGLEFIEAEL